MELYKGIWSDARDTKKMPPTLVFLQGRTYSWLAWTEQLADSPQKHTRWGQSQMLGCALVRAAHLWC